jgi:hypothetical protein
MRAMMPPITTSNHSTPPIPSAPAPLLHAKAAEETQFNHLRFPAGHLLQPRQRFIQCEQLTAPVGSGDGSSSRLTAVEWRPRANGKVVIFLPSSPRLRAAGPTASRICAGPSGSFPQRRHHRVAESFDLPVRDAEIARSVYFWFAAWLPNFEPQRKIRCRQDIRSAASRRQLVDFRPLLRRCRPIRA